MAFGQHNLEYEVLEGWEQLPEGWSFLEVAGVAVVGLGLYVYLNPGFLCIEGWPLGWMGVSATSASG